MEDSWKSALGDMEDDVAEIERLLGMSDGMPVIAPAGGNHADTGWSERRSALDSGLAEYMDRLKKVILASLRLKPPPGVSRHAWREALDRTTGLLESGDLQCTPGMRKTLAEPPPRPSSTVWSRSAGAVSAG